MTCQLYLITPPCFEVETFRSALVSALDAGPVACVQLRLKNADGSPPERSLVRATAQALIDDVQSRDVAFVINDDPELAHELGADGVHVGQNDVSAKVARTIVGPDAIVGVTCHDSRDLAFQASEAGADYVAFGAFFPTKSKTVTATPKLEILDIWSTTTNVPCVAIGGITLDNAPLVVKAGADFIAVLSAVWDCDAGPAQAVKSFNALLDKC